MRYPNGVEGFESLRNGFSVRDVDIASPMCASASGLAY